MNLIKFKAGAKPEKKLSNADKKDWQEIYRVLSKDDKMILESQEQTRLIRRISNNILFYFWLTIICLISYLLILIF
jgi:diaminopimelate decarboxylase|tara:strand:- start:179 stop:406 length:228 start_codon:yes stop_codon:yes gene_type:complete